MFDYHDCYLDDNGNQGLRGLFSEPEIRIFLDATITVIEHLLYLQLQDCLDRVDKKMQGSRMKL